MGRPELTELKLNRTGRYKHVLRTIRTQPLQDISVVCCNYIYTLTYIGNLAQIQKLQISVWLLTILHMKWLFTENEGQRSEHIFFIFSSRK